MEKLIDLFSRGGPVMYAIAAASVLGLAVFIERQFALVRSNVLPAEFCERITALIKAGKVHEAMGRCAESESSIARVLLAVLRHADEPLPVVKEAAEEVGRREAARLEKYVGALGTVATVSPLLGLLGTVTGMIGVFQRVSDSGVGDPLQMASGIWEALITTAFGLGVGIPALIAHRYTLSRVDALVLELEEEAMAVLDLVHVDDDDVPTQNHTDADEEAADANAP